MKKATKLVTALMLVCTLCLSLAPTAKADSAARIACIVLCSAQQTFCYDGCIAGAAIRTAACAGAGTVTDIKNCLNDVANELTDCKNDCSAAGDKCVDKCPKE
jgi:hypothetical protein